MVEKIETYGNLNFGYAPPHSLETERSVLGSLINEPIHFDEVVAICHVKECFYAKENEIVYEAMMDLRENGSDIDILTLSDNLSKKGKLELIGGAYALVKLSQNVTNSANVFKHAGIVKQKFMSREISRICGKALTDANKDQEDIFTQIDNLTTSLDGITKNISVKEPNHISRSVQRTLDKIEELKKSKYDYTGVPSGYPILDKITGGWQQDDFIIISAEASTGKTAFGVNIAWNAANNKNKPTPAAFFSLEMGDVPLTQRLISNVSGVELWRIRTPKVLNADEDTKIINAGILIGSKPVYLDSPSNLTIFEFRAKLRRLIQKHNVGLVIVDYLQFLKTKTKSSDNREQEVSKVSRELKETAKDFHIPIIAISSLNRAGQLRDSGNLDFDADIKINLKKPTSEEIKEFNLNENDRMIDITKHRNGETNCIQLRFIKDFQRFEDLSEQGMFPDREDLKPDNPRAGIVARDITQSKQLPWQDEF